MLFYPSKHKKPDMQSPQYPFTNMQGRNQISYRNSQEPIVETQDFSTSATIQGLDPSLCLNPENLPSKRQNQYSDLLTKKPKSMPVTDEEWEPFSKALLSIEFSKNAENLNDKEIRERQEIAKKMSTPEGLFEIITDLEAKLARFEDSPIDPEFDGLSIVEKIDKLFNTFLLLK